MENTDKNQHTAACCSDLPPLCDELSPGVSSPRASCRLRPPSGKELLQSYYIVAREMQISQGRESPSCLPASHICLALHVALRRQPSWEFFLFALNLVSTLIWTATLCLAFGCIHQEHAPVSQATHKTAPLKKCQGLVFIKLQFYFVSATRKAYAAKWKCHLSQRNTQRSWFTVSAGGTFASPRDFQDFQVFQGFTVAILWNLEHWRVSGSTACLSQRDFLSVCVASWWIFPLLTWW